MTQGICETCEKRFEVQDLDAKQRRTCSKTCANQLNWKRRRERTGSPELTTLFALVAEASLQTDDIEEQARIVGVSVFKLYHVRHKAKVAGFDVAPVKARHNVSDRIVEIEAEMVRAGACPRCFLRGKHVCTTQGLVDLVESRMSVWVEPSHDIHDDSALAPASAVSGLEALASAAIQRDMDALELRRMLVAAGACNVRGTARPVATEVIDRVIAESRKVAA